VSLLFIFRFDRFLLRLLFRHVYVLSHRLHVLIFNVLVHLSSGRDLSHLILLAFDLSALHIHVAASLAHNVVGSFAGLIDFFDGLALLGLQQANTVAEQLQVFFGALSRHLSRDELAMQSLVVVLLIWGQVELFLLLWMLVRVFLRSHVS